ncbi:seryl-tRNA synthetase [Coemansia spiralis]|nr:seryl-tRNA synthetase [Coemansia spiralis]
MRLVWRAPRLLLLAGRQRRTLIQPSFDYKHIRDHASQLLDNAAKRNVQGTQPHRVGELYDEFRALVSASNEHRSALNAASRELGALARAAKGPISQPADPAAEAALREQARAAKLAIHEIKGRLDAVDAELQREAASIPNMSHPDTPVGDESCARVVRTHGTLHTVGKVPRDGVDTQALSDADFRDHADLALQLGIIDMEAGARVAGSRFHYWRGAGALLELALVQYAMTRAAAAGFTLHITPDVARSSVVAACGFQPRPAADEATAGGGEASQIYRVSSVARDPHGADGDADPLCLVATAEIPLVAMQQQQILGRGTLPVSLAGLSHCFRAEAGARGRDTRGIYRLHQFTKVELVVLAAPERSDAELARLVAFQESLYADLGLTFRVLQMPTQELGASAYQKFDVEAWMPGRRAWGEIASASNCTDYQARRLGIRVRASTPGAALAFVHTLNATAVAVPRLVVALLESFQRPDGSVAIPKALQPWMMGMQALDPAGGPAATR